MKKMFGLFVAIIMFSLFSSCKKDNLPTPVNTDAIKAQLSLISLPSKEEVQKFLSSTSLKSTEDANPAVTLIEIFPLSPNTYQVSTDYAEKYLIYYEINANGYREKLLTVRQEFRIVNGKVDSTYYSFDYEVGCGFSQYFGLKNWNGLSNITYYFRFNDGKQFAYYGQNNGNILLPPIDGGKWQIKLHYSDGDMNQTFMTNMFDFYDQSYFLDLNLEMKKENTVAIIQMGKDYIKGAYNIELFGEDPDGNFLYFDCPILYDEKLPDMISYSAPFDIKGIYICGMNGCWVAYTRYLNHTMEGGKIIYQLN